MDRILYYRRGFTIARWEPAAKALGAIADPALSRCIAPPAQERSPNPSLERHEGHRIGDKKCNNHLCHGNWHLPGRQAAQFSTLVEPKFSPMVPAGQATQVSMFLAPGAMDGAFFREKLGKIGAIFCSRAQGEATVVSATTFSAVSRTCSS